VLPADSADVKGPLARLGSKTVRSLGALTGSGWTFDPLGAVLRVPAIAVALALGAATGKPLVGVLAAGGAFTVGFGAPLGLRGSNSLLLALASVAIGSSAVVGSFAAWNDVTVVAFAACLGALCGVAMPRGPGVAWVALQCALAGVVATSYPASLQGAERRAIVIVAGGALQTALIACARHALRRHLPPQPPTEPETPHYAVHLAVGLAIAAGIAHATELRSGYWVPLTTLLVLRPGARSTMTRALSRTGGTVGGAALASAFIVALHPSWAVLAVLVAAAAFGAYLFQKATYGLLSAFVTVYVVFILSLAGLPEGKVALARIAATVIGGAIGIAVEAVGEVVARSRAGALSVDDVALAQRRR